MKSLAKLKDQARTHEQKEEWEKAIEVYLQVLQIGEQGESEVELPLYNRIGDLYVRLGRANDAVNYYEQAADRYADAGLYNNAIALCNKALRYVPKRLSIYRKLGQFSASQGFLTDARRWFLEYAEQKLKEGATDDAFSALSDFANIAEEPEIRELLGRQLHAHGRDNEAVHELKRAHTMRSRAGQTAEAAALADEIHGIDPHANLDVPTERPAALAGQPHEHEAEVALPGLTDIGLESVAGAAFGGEPEAGVGLDAGNITLDTSDIQIDHGPAGLDPGEIELDSGLISLDSDVHAELDELEDVAPLPLMDFDSGAEDEEDVHVDLPGLSGLEDIGYADEEAHEPLPLLGEDEEDAGVFTLDTGSFATEDEEQEEDAFGGGDLSSISLGGLEEEEEEEAADETPFEPLPTFDDALPDFGSDEIAAALPDLGTPPEPTRASVPAPAHAVSEELDTAVTSIPRAPERVRPAVPELEPALAHARALAESGERQTALAELERLHTMYSEADRFESAHAVVGELLRLDPGNMRLLQQSVEYAARWGATEPMVSSYLELAHRLTHSGASTKARAVYARVLDLDPGNAAALAATQTKKEPASKKSDYVDLNSLLQSDDDEDSTSTRFVVAEKAPTGDEEKDFADLLSQFRAKVSENVGADDPASHYDLGLAFKEMGLVDEAISEFQTALKGGQERLQVYEELGQCFMLKEQYNVAVKVLSRALQMPRNDESELLGVYYHLGRCFEELGNRGEARDAYERVIGLDIQFRDVSQRLARL